MDSREETLVKLALIFLVANIDAAIETFSSDEELPDGKINFNGIVIDAPDADEVAMLAQDFEAHEEDEEPEGFR